MVSKVTAIEVRTVSVLAEVSGKKLVSDCVAVLEKSRDKHYDHATKEERMERREDYLVDV